MDLTFRKLSIKLVLRVRKRYSDEEQLGASGQQYSVLCLVQLMILSGEMKLMSNFHERNVI